MQNRALDWWGGVQDHRVVVGGRRAAGNLPLQLRVVIGEPAVACAQVPTAGMAERGSAEVRKARLLTLTDYSQAKDRKERKKNQLYKMDFLETLKSTLHWAVGSSPVTSLVGKESARNVGGPSSIPETREDPLEKEIATHSSILAWKIPWTRKPGGLQSMGSQRVGVDWQT